LPGHLLQAIQFESSLSVPKAIHLAVFKGFHVSGKQVTPLVVFVQAREKDSSEVRTGRGWSQGGTCCREGAAHRCEYQEV
jgi:hypothetical protein